MAYGRRMSEGLSLPATPTQAGTVKVAAAPPSGVPVAADRMVGNTEVLLSSTSPTTVVAFTPQATGWYEVLIYFRVVTAATAVTISISYSDPSGAQTNTVLNNATMSVNSYSMNPIPIYAATSSSISVQFTAGTANHVYASALIYAR